jgi:hypothetical protein
MANAYFAATITADVIRPVRNNLTRSILSKKSSTLWTMPCFSLYTLFKLGPGPTIRGETSSSQLAWITP